MTRRRKGTIATFSVLMLLLGVVLWWVNRPSDRGTSSSELVFQPAQPRAPRVGSATPPREPSAPAVNDQRPDLDAADDPLPDLDARGHMEAGQVAFDDRDAALGYRHFLAVIEDDPDHPLAPFALYKLAWAEYNLGDHQAALDDFELLLAWVEGDPSPMARMLRTEAAEDIETIEDELENGDPITPGWP